MSWRENRGGRGHSRGGRGRGGNRGGNRGGGYRGNFQNRPYNKRPQDQNNENKRAKFEVTSRLKEVDIGVTEFIGDHEHFNGILKERFSDFQVHEIGNNGEIAKLTTQDTPSDPIDTTKLDDMKKSLPQEILEKIELMSTEDSEINSVEIDVSDMDKDLRRNIHTIAKQIPSVQSQTVEKDKKKFMVLQKSKKPRNANYKTHRDTRVDWENRGGPYCQFVLHKVNMDTMDALNQLAYNLRIKTNMIMYSGTKDRRARTSQWVSLKRITPYDILQAGKRITGAYVGNFKIVAEPLKLGTLIGNRFTIALRNVSGTDDEIEKAMTNLRDKGFINYYGLQRFGTVSAIPTWQIGRALLQGKWNEAIELILKPRPGESKDMTAAREVYAKTKDAGDALKHIHRQDKLEAKLLQGLVSNGGKNPQSALDSVPRNTRLMYIHAYQSYVWNYMVSRRIREFGCKPIVGDLVYETPETTDETVESVAPAEDENSKPVEAENPAEKMDSEGKTEDKLPGDEKPVKDGEKMEAEPTAEEENIPEAETKSAEVKSEEGDIEKDHRALEPVKILTEEDLSHYTFADIVMPQPGYRVTYPSFAKAWYDEFLKQDGLDTDLRQKNRKYSLGGTYRKILQVPENLSWKIMHYSEISAELIRSDIDEFREKEEPKDDPEGKHKALILEMVLKPSTYATMALREILKHDTSAETQAAQSAAHHAAQKPEEAKKDGVEPVKMDLEEVEAKVGDQMEVGEEEAKQELPMEAEASVDANAKPEKPQDTQ